MGSKNRPFSSIGKRARFSAPAEVRDDPGTPSGRKWRKGTIIDEIWADSGEVTSPARPPKRRGDWGDYAACSQLIEWDRGDYGIRVTYYRRKCGEKKWKTTNRAMTEGPSKVRQLLKKTLAQRSWYLKKPKPRPQNY